MGLLLDGVYGGYCPSRVISRHRNLQYLPTRLSAYNSPTPRPLSNLVRFHPSQDFPIKSLRLLLQCLNIEIAEIHESHRVSQTA